MNQQRLLAQSLGLGLLTAGAVLGGQGAAQALQYVFTASDGSPGPLQLNFRFNGTLFNGFTGSGRVTGSFNYVGGNSINNVGVTFTSDTSNTQSASFSTGYYNPATSTLYFGITSGDCPSGTTTCLELNLQGAGISNNPGELVGFESGADNLGDYFNPNNSQFIFGITRLRDLSLVDGALRQIPAPLSALALLPLAGMKRYRRRLQRLSQTRGETVSSP